jgi:Zinc knuckle
VVKLKVNECPDECFSDMLYLNEQIVRASVTKNSDAEIIAHIINAAPKFYIISLSIISQCDIFVSDALSKAQTELRNYWKSNLEGKISRQQGRQSNGRNESAYSFSGGKSRSYQGNTSPSGPSQSYGRNKRGKRGTGNKTWKKCKGFCKYCGKQGRKAINCNYKPQRTTGHSVNRTAMKNHQMRCYQCGQPGHYSRNCPEKRQNNMGRQPKLFNGLIEHSVNILSHTGSNKPWILELDSSTSSAGNMDQEDQKPAWDPNSSY